MATKSKTVLITGCSAGGVGPALAAEIAKRGHRVFATARNTAKIPADLRELENVTLLQLDVSSPESIELAGKSVRETGYGLDVLVNNAGEEYTVPLLDADIEQSQYLFDVNMWGPLRLAQTFADLLVESRGRIVNVTSVDAELCPPWIGIYSASKAALNAFSETLRLEMMPLGVQVVLIKVGDLQTRHRSEPGPTLPEESYYMGVLDFITRCANGKLGPERGSIDSHIDAIVEDVIGVRTTKAGIVWRGAHAGASWFALRFLPTYIVDQLVTKDHGIEELTQYRIRAKSQ